MDAWSQTTATGLMPMACSFCTTSSSSRRRSVAPVAFSEKKKPNTCFQFMVSPLTINTSASLQGTGFFSGSSTSPSTVSRARTYSSSIRRLISSKMTTQYRAPSGSTWHFTCNNSKMLSEKPTRVEMPRTNRCRVLSEGIVKIFFTVAYAEGLRK